MICYLYNFIISYLREMPAKKTNGIHYGVIAHLRDQEGADGKKNRKVQT